METYVNQLVDGLSLTLREAFPDIENLYIEQVPQGFTKPCFLLRLINADEVQRLGNWWRENVMVTYHMADYMFEIRYHTDELDKNQRCYGMAEKLYTLLFNFKKMRLWGSDMNYEVSDNVLHYFVTYQVSLYRTTPHDYDKMGTLRTRSEIKDEEQRR